MPAPVSASASALSMSATRKPRAASARAAVSPPRPAPATTIVRADTRSTLFDSGFGRLEGAFGRPGLPRTELWVVAVEGRAIRADDLVVAAHVEIDMRMVERRQGADAHELARADLDHRNAGIIVEMGNDRLGHGIGSVNGTRVGLADHSGAGERFLESAPGHQQF